MEFVFRILEKRQGIMRKDPRRDIGSFWVLERKWHGTLPYTPEGK